MSSRAALKHILFIHVACELIIPQFPNAFQEYKQICTVKPSSSLSLSVHQQSLPGQCLLISIGHDIDSNIPEGSYYHIASLITSEGYGKTVSPKDDITTSTELAITDLQAKLSALKKTALPVGDIYAVKINSGLFKVPWLETKRTLEAGPLDLIIVSPPA